MFDLILDAMNGFSAKIGPIVPLGGCLYLFSVAVCGPKGVAPKGL
jgi:hypothetical protein